MVDLLLKNATLSDGRKGYNLAIEKGTIIKIRQNITDNASKTIDLQGQLVIPGFVESHLHLDIALMNNLEHPGRPTPFRSPVELSRAMENRRKTFTREDIEQRASLGLEMASRQGVIAMRAQCHVDQEIGLKHVKALVNVRENLKCLCCCAKLLSWAQM